MENLKEVAEELAKLQKSNDKILEALLGDRFDEDRPGLVRQAHTNAKNIERNFRKILELQRECVDINDKIIKIDRETKTLKEAHKELKNPFGKILLSATGGTLVGAGGATFGEKIFIWLKHFFIYLFKSGGPS